MFFSFVIAVHDHGFHEAKTLNGFLEFLLFLFGRGTRVVVREDELFDVYLFDFHRGKIKKRPCDARFRGQMVFKTGVPIFA
jgi:hypothetical protein